MLIITADDYGKNRKTTDNIIRCYSNKRISCASAMVFMKDSERAASLSKNSGLEIGLHLNFTDLFNDQNVSITLYQHQRRIAQYLQSNKIFPIIFNPWLSKSFSFVFRAQEDEFRRLYGKVPDFYNGHHHMHLCANMILGNFIPKNSRVRRTYTFDFGEKNILNISYRKYINRWISRKFISTNRFLSVAPIEDIDRLSSIFKRSQSENIEIEVHPEIEKELTFLLGKEFKQLLDKIGYSSFLQI
jgi:chitin disaccharide deacetylase